MHAILIQMVILASVSTSHPHRTGSSVQFIKTYNPYADVHHGWMDVQQGAGGGGAELGQ